MFPHIGDAGLCDCTAIDVVAAKLAEWNFKMALPDVPVKSATCPVSGSRINFN